MSDVLEGGSRRPPWPRWARLAVTVVAALAIGVYGVITFSGQDPSSPAAGATRSPSPSPSWLPGVPDSSSQFWPGAEGACGSSGERPIGPRIPLRAETDLRVMTGGAEIAEVDVDTGNRNVLLQVPDSRNRHVQTLARSGADMYALVAACDGRPDPGPAVFRIGTNGLLSPVRMSGSVDDLIAGPPGVWGVDRPSDPRNPVILRVPGGGALRMAPWTAPVGVTRTGILGVVDPKDPGRPSALTMLDPTTGETETLLARGRPLAVGADFMVYEDGACQAPGRVSGQECTLIRTDLPVGEDPRSYPMPAGRRAVSDGTVDPNGRLVAFHLSRPETEVRFDDRHPGPPSEIAVLDLETGLLQIVPGLVFAPKTSADLAFTPDRRSLVISVNHGDHGHLLVWRRGDGKPKRVDGNLGGPLAQAPRILVVD